MSFWTYEQSSRAALAPAADCWSHPVAHATPLVAGMPGAPTLASSRRRARCRRRRDSLLSRAVLLMPLVLGLLAALAPAGADLEWSAPADCPPREAVEASAAALLGRPLATGDPGTRVRARAVVTREAQGFRLDLELHSDAGRDRRSLRDRRCQVLADAAAEILATAVDPRLGAGVPPALPPEPDRTWREGPAPSDMSPQTFPPEPAPPPAPEPAPPTAPSPTAPADPLEPPQPAPVAAPPAAPPDRLRGSLRLSGVFDQGGLPGPTGGLTAAFGVMRRAWRLELGVLGLIPRDTRPDPDRPPGARLSLWTGFIRGCGVARLRPRLELAGCGGLEIGALLGAGLGVDDARTRAQPWLAAVVGPELAWPVGRRVALTLGVDAVVAILRPLFVVAGGPVFRAHPAAFRATLGVQLRIP